LCSSLLLLAPTPGNAIAFLRDASRTSKLPQLSLIFGGIIPIPLLFSSLNGFVQKSKQPLNQIWSTEVFFFFPFRSLFHRAYSEGEGANWLSA
jgi:hypothetical protein